MRNTETDRQIQTHRDRQTGNTGVFWNLLVHPH